MEQGSERKSSAYQEPEHRISIPFTREEWMLLLNTGAVADSEWGKWADVRQKVRDVLEGKKR